jgi:glycosyltransferase involved in cell wall biosynthesis
MKVLMLSWEYPPMLVGGLGRHVYALSRELAKRGLEVGVVTVGDTGNLGLQVEGGVKVYRVKAHGLVSPDFTSWVHELSLLMIRAAGELMGEEPADLIHAHDWLVAPAAIALKHLHRIPLIATIHATEWGRRGGVRDGFQRHIHEVEWWLTYESWRTICCSRHMKWEVTTYLGVPPNKVEVVYNGFTPFGPPKPVQRSKFAEPWEQIVLTVGRMVYEKGQWVLVEAAPHILARDQRAKFVLVGDGPTRAQLERRIAELGLEEKFYFTGFVPDDVLAGLYSIASVAVFPSLYEPFGIVALEAMAMGKPVVVSAVGGFDEIVADGVTGLKVPPSDPKALAEAVLRLLGDRELAGRLGAQARERALTMSWAEAALRVEAIYRHVLEEWERAGWKPTFRRSPHRP